LKPFLFLSAAVLFTLAQLPASARPPQDAAPATTSKNPVKPTPQSQEKAKAVYKMDCALCHGDNGNGKTDVAASMSLVLADWTDPKSLAGKSDQELFDKIRKGSDKMPPEDASRAKNDEVWNLIIYIRGMAKDQPAATPAETPAAAPAPDATTSAPPADKPAAPNK
jgi:cytochrome c5